MDKRTLLAVALCAAQVEAGQSLAGVAERTAVERKSAPASKSYGDSDLKPAPGAAPAEGSRTVDGTAGVEAVGGLVADTPREDVVRAVMPNVINQFRIVAEPKSGESRDSKTSLRRCGGGTLSHSGERECTGAGRAVRPDRQHQ